MGTVFEFVLVGDSEIHLRAAGEEALAEIDRLEDQLSVFLPSSEVSSINAGAGRGAMSVEPRLYRLLERAGEIAALTGGAFDPAVAPLLEAWGLREGRGRSIEAARKAAGWRNVRLAGGRVRFAHPESAMDLGAIGKGYALDRAAEVLRSRGVRSAFLHGGTSSLYGLGAPPDEERGWPCGVVDPRQQAGRAGDPERRLGTVYLRDASLSVSSPAGRTATVQPVGLASRGRTVGHVIDPRTGEPVYGVSGAWCVSPSAADADALSTAFLVMGPDETERFLAGHPEVQGAVLTTRSRLVASLGLALSRPPRAGPACWPRQSRRDFLKGAVAAASVAFAAGLAPRRAWTEDEKPREVSLAVIGVGEHGRLLLSQLLRLPGVKVAAIADVHPPHLEQAIGITGRNVETYDDASQLLEEEDVDAVVVATPPHAHATLCIAALAAGRDVFVEPPLALSIEECRQVVQAARKADRIVHVGHQRRTSLLYPHALTHIQSGAIGTLTHVRCQWQRKQSWRRAVEGAHEKLLNWRLYRETSHGLLGEYGVHHLDLVNWYADGTPVAVTGLGALAHWKDGREVDDSVQAVFEYPRGVLVQWSAALTSTFQEEFELFQGTDGAILLSGQRKGLLFREADAPAQGWEVYAKKEMLGPERGIILDAMATKYVKQLAPEELGPDAGKADFHAELAAFLESVRKRTPAPCGVEAGLKSAVACVVAAEAIAKRTTIKFETSHFEVQ